MSTHSRPAIDPPFRLAAGLVVALVVLALALINWQLWTSHADERSRAIQGAEKRAVQLAAAVADRINVLVRSTDFVLLQVRRDFGSDDARFHVLADSLLASFPERSLLQLSFANADGELTYSSLGPTGRASIRDREHFKAHLDGGDRLHISKPLRGRVSRAWTVQFSRPVLRDGRFAGVAVVSLAPEYISQVLATLELAPEDGISLFDGEGSYLARNRNLDKVLGQTLSPERPFMRPDAAPSGTFRAAAFADGVDRLYAWQRVPGTQLVVNVGLAAATVLAPLEAHFAQDRLQGGLLSAVLIALGMAVLVLLGRLSRGQRELGATATRFKSLTSLSSDWYWEQDSQFRFVAMEGALQERTGISSTEHIGKTRWELPALNMTEADWARHRALLDAHLPFHDLEMRRPDAGGRSHWVSISGEPVFDEQGAFRGYRGVGRDINQRKLAEEARDGLELQLRQAHKMEALGTLAGGIAHDFNNLLAAILGNAALARQETGADSPLLPRLAEIAKAGNRARDLVRQILTFSRRQPLERRVVDFREVARDAIGLLRASLPTGIELQADLADDTPNVVADRTQLHQVLMNLGANAGQALAGQQGRIVISLAAANVDGDAASGLGLTPGRYTRLGVSDNGPGMDEATLRCIFDPFFTTKPIGEGTGLGLSVVEGIVKTHGGAIAVDSAPGRGSAFHLYFPAAASAVATEDLPAAPPPRPGAGQRVLYLDDEEALVLIAQAMLQRLGYRVQGFTLATEALAAFRADPAAFDLLVTDFNMPGASGLEVAGEMLRLRPGLPVVLASGFVTAELRAQAAAIGIREVIYKPHTIEDLAAALQQLLAGRA